MYKINCSAYTVKAHRYNEDCFVRGKNFYAVLDGATPLGEKAVNTSSASRFVKYLKRELETAGNISDMTAYLNKLSSKAFLQSFESGVSCGIAVVQFLYPEVNIYLLGDCEVAAVLKNKQVIRYLTGDLPALDKIALDKMVNIARTENIAMTEAREKINQTLIEHRNLKNKEGGYAVFEPMENADFKVERHQLNINDIDCIYIYSDGFAQAFTTFHIFENYVDMFSKDLNVKEVALEIKRFSLQDGGMEKYPRFKKLDDITAVKLGIKEI